MEEPTNKAEIELLTRIHNQLVDLTKLIAEIELSKTNSELLKAKLREISANAPYVSGSGHGETLITHQQRVIAPVDKDIEPGEGSKDK